MSILLFDKGKRKSSWLYSCLPIDSTPVRRGCYTMIIFISMWHKLVALEESSFLTLGILFCLHSSSYCCIELPKGFSSWLLPHGQFTWKSPRKGHFKSTPKVSLSFIIVMLSRTVLFLMYSLSDWASTDLVLKFWAWSHTQSFLNFEWRVS